MASKYNQPKRSKTALSWPLSPPRTPALHRGDGTRGTFRPWRSGPDQLDQAHHFPEAPVPRPRKSMHWTTRGVPRVARTLNLADSRLIHRVSKKLCQLNFCSLSVKYEPISMKIGRIVPKEALNETALKLPTSPKVCACTTLENLKCQIEPSTQ